MLVEEKEQILKRAKEKYIETLAKLKSINR